MAKLVLTDLSSLTNETSALALMKANNDALRAAMENTVSRDGTLPNQMNSSFDMNSNRILNLPSPVSSTEPLRLQDLNDFVASGGAAGGSNTQVQYNKATALAGNAGFTYAEGGAVSISPTASTNNSALIISQSTPNGGSVAGPISAVNIVLTAGTQTVTGGTDVFGEIANRTNALNVGYNVTGGSANHFGINSIMNVTASNGGVVGVCGGIFANSGTTSSGNLWGADFFVKVGPTTTLTQTATAILAEVGIASGGGARDRLGMEICAFGPTAGTTNDAAVIVFLDAGETAPYNGAAGFNDGIYFSSNYFLANQFPIASTGNIFRADTGTVGTIFNFTGVTSTTILSTPNVTIAGTGAASFGGALVAGSVKSYLPINIQKVSAGALIVGPDGIASHVTFEVDNSATNCATGLYVLGAAAGNGLTLITASPNTNENLTINSRGSGSTTLTHSGASAFTLNVGTVASAAGSIALASPTSNSLVLASATSATGTATFPSGTYNVVGDSVTQTFTNKTFNSTATGNVLQVSGVTVSAGQYPGEPSNGSATAGNVGEYVTASGTGVASASGAQTNATSISLTAGDWDVSGYIVFNFAATTTAQTLAVGVSTTSATLGTQLSSFNFGVTSSIVPNGNFTLSSPMTRISIASTTTVFLVGLINYGTSTASINSSLIRARRVR